MTDVTQLVLAIEQVAPEQFSPLICDEWRGAGGRLFIFTTECCANRFQGEGK